MRNRSKQSGMPGDDSDRFSFCSGSAWHGFLNTGMIPRQNRPAVPGIAHHLQNRLYKDFMRLSLFLRSAPLLPDRSLAYSEIRLRTIAGRDYEEIVGAGIHSGFLRFRQLRHPFIWHAIGPINEIPGRWYTGVPKVWRNVLPYYLVISGYFNDTPFGPFGYQSVAVGKALC
jgi:hypothetical protein